MGVHGKTIFDWQRNLEYQDIDFGVVVTYFGDNGWMSFLKNYTSMKRPSSVTKDIIRESANILFEYEILDAESQKPGKEYQYFINNAEVRVVSSRASGKNHPMTFDGGELLVGVFSGTDDDSFVYWIESDIQPRYSYYQYVYKRWSPDSYAQDEIVDALLGRPDTVVVLHNKQVRGMKINEVRDIELSNGDTFKIKRVI